MIIFKHYLFQSLLQKDDTGKLDDHLDILTMQHGHHHKEYHSIDTNAMLESERENQFAVV